MEKNHAMSRVMRTKTQARVNYDRLSRWYDLLSAGSETPFITAGVKDLGNCTGKRILEIGCGTGSALLTLLQSAGDTGSVHAVDLSIGMLKQAKRNIMKEKMARKCLLQAADGENLPYKDNSFDRLFMAFVLELFDTPDIPAVFTECRRVLKPDGLICIVAMAREANETLPVRIYEFFHRIMPVSVDCRPIFLQSLLEDAEFHVISSRRRMMWGLPVEICLAAPHFPAGDLR